MDNLGAKEAADRIRGVFFSDRSARTDPEQAHQMKFAKDVCRELGADESAETVQHVVTLLREHGVALHAGHEYPKFATRKWDRSSKIVHSEDEENAWVDEAQPEPVDPATVPARTLEAPVQDLSLDLRDKVPHMTGDAPPAQRPARIPSAVTNREAAQDAHARQPVSNRDAAAAAYDKANPDLDHTNADAAHGVGTFEDVQTDHDGDIDPDFVDEDEVHVEDVNTLAGSGDASKGGAPYVAPANVGVMANDDPDRDDVEGQDVNPTHDSLLGTQHPQDKSGDSSAGKTDKGRRPVGTRRPT